MFDDYNNGISYPESDKVDNQKWDPRLFHTVGMPTYPYKYEAEYTMTINNSRSPNTYGYYTSLKEVPQRSKGETFNGSWQAFAMNEYVFRFTDVMLFRAEALIELNELEQARTIINNIRQRAANSVDKHIEYAKGKCEIALYPESYFQDIETARKCLRWERRLEMAMESGRYFDLRRWMDAPVEEAVPVYGCNMLASEAMKDQFHTPSMTTTLPTIFANKMWLWPINHSELKHNENLVQNPGWTNPE